jgi:glycine/sarcosine N-methyltransferase
MYDTFSSDYDRFVNWSGRLDLEMPWLERQIQVAANISAANEQPPRVLDAACGTGMHAITLAQHGYRAVGADLSAGMVEQARLNARSAGVDVPFIAAGFGELAAVFRAKGDRLAFDALLCLGNSLPHLLNPEAVTVALRDFAACLRPGGVLVIQNRNFDAVLQQNDRWMDPQDHREGDAEWLFLRFYDFLPDGLIRFNIVTEKRVGSGGWQQTVISTPLYPLRQEELLHSLEQAGFSQVQAYGNMNGAPYDPASSGNLVMTARLG